MKCFITGATGFVGRALTQFLVSQDHELTALIRDVPRTEFKELPPEWIVFGDVRDFKRMREILLDQKPEAIIHLAAQAIVSQAHTDPLSTYEINVGGTIALLQAWREASPDAYYLHLSTDKVYGNGMNKPESEPVQASGVYESSKAAGDLITQSYLPKVCIVRPCNIYGPGDRNRRIIPNTIQECMRGDKPWIFRNAGKREYIYIDDVCQCVGKLIAERKTGVWNVGSGLVLSNEQVVSEILKHFPNLTAAYGASPMPELDDQSLNSKKLCENLDCLSFTTFPAGIKATVDWWRSIA